MVSSPHCFLYNQGNLKFEFLYFFLLNEIHILNLILQIISKNVNPRRKNYLLKRNFFLIFSKITETLGKVLFFSFENFSIRIAKKKKAFRNILKSDFNLLNFTEKKKWAKRLFNLREKDSKSPFKLSKYNFFLIFGYIKKNRERRGIIDQIS